jgi:diguanylate cyclase (GGDEF)-like protein
MDAKTSTQICPSVPYAEAGADAGLEGSAAVYMIVVSGGVPGSMLQLNAGDITLGRASETVFQLDDLTVSRQHARLTLDAEGDVHITDLASSNGTFVNGIRIAGHCPTRLADGDRIQLGRNVVLKLVRLDPHDERFQRDLFERTVRDPLTLLYNRGYFLSQIGVLAERSASQEIGLAILMLDIDHFKHVNDRYGHVAGDDVLREVATVIRESTRSEDLVARYGGEEFVVALPVSVPTGASERAERIRLALARRRMIVTGHEIHITASLGLSFSPPGRSRHPMALLQAADQALYQAKATGRNRVVSVCPTMQPEPKQTESALFAWESASFSSLAGE